MESLLRSCPSASLAESIRASLASAAPAPVMRGSAHNAPDNARASLPAIQSNATLGELSEEMKSTIARWRAQAIARAKGGAQ